MDPNLIHLDWERTFEAIGLIIVLAFVVERALSIIFENYIYIRRFDRPGFKELLALGVSVAVCWVWKFDAVSMFLLTDKTTVPGYFLTGAVVAGGSKASIKLFHDLMNVKSSAYDQRHDIQAEAAASDAEGAAAAAQAVATPSGLVKYELKAAKALAGAKRAADSSGTESAKLALDRAVEAMGTIEKLAREQKKGGAGPAKP